jgi:hypothetical protein
MVCDLNRRLAISEASIGRKEISSESGLTVRKKEVIGRIRTAFSDIYWVLDEMRHEDDKVFSGTFRCASGGCATQEQP